jgi:hypothetical protein
MFARNLTCKRGQGALNGGRSLLVWPNPCYRCGFASFTVARCLMLLIIAQTTTVGLSTSQIVLSICTILVSGVASAFVTFKLNQTHQQELLLR